MVLLLVWWRPPCPQVIEVRDQTGNDDYQGCDEYKAGIVHAEKECSDYHTVPLSPSAPAKTGAEPLHGIGRKTGRWMAAHSFIVNARQICDRR
jgi:hypothetical protein